MRILYYSAHPYASMDNTAGYATHMRGVINGFKGHGHEVIEVIMGNINKKAGQKSDKGLGLKNLARKVASKNFWESMKDRKLLILDKSALQTISKEIKLLKPDIIYERINYLQSSGMEAANKYKVPLYLEVNAPQLEERIELSGTSSLLEKAREIEVSQFEKAQKIFFVSSALKNHYAKYYDLPKNKIISIPNAATAGSIEIDNHLKESLTTQYEFLGKKVVGFVGSIFNWHGVDILIEAMASIKYKIPDVKLLIVGGGEALEDLQKLTETLGLSDKIIFTGPVDHNDVKTYISLMDITVLPKINWYNSPIKIFEYGAMRKTIIAPDTEPVKEVMKHNEDGVLVPPDVGKLSSAIEQLLSDPDKAQKMAVSFYKKVQDKYTWEHVTKKILAEIKMPKNSKAKAAK